MRSIHSSVLSSAVFAIMMVLSAVLLQSCAPPPPPLSEAEKGTQAETMTPEERALNTVHVPEGHKVVSITMDGNGLLLLRFATRMMKPEEKPEVYYLWSAHKDLGHQPRMYVTPLGYRGVGDIDAPVAMLVEHAADTPKKE